MQIRKKHLMPAVAGVVAALTAFAYPQLFGGNALWWKILAVGTGGTVALFVGRLWPSRT